MTETCPAGCRHPEHGHEMRAVDVILADPPPPPQREPAYVEVADSSSPPEPTDTEECRWALCEHPEWEDGYCWNHWSYQQMGRLRPTEVDDSPLTCLVEDCETDRSSPIDPLCSDHRAAAEANPDGGPPGWKRKVAIEVARLEEAQRLRQKWADDIRRAAPQAAGPPVVHTPRSVRADQRWAEAHRSTEAAVKRSVGAARKKRRRAGVEEPWSDSHEQATVELTRRANRLFVTWAPAADTPPPRF